MKIAILSDIHSNIHALEAVWKDINYVQPDEIYCLGDLVGYGAYPNDTIDFVRKNNITTVMGNYDDAVGFDRASCGCNYNDPDDIARSNTSLLWTKQNTSVEGKDYLREFPKSIRRERLGHRLLFVHGSPRSTNEYLFADRRESTFERIARMAETDVIFCGHTHLHYQKYVDGTVFINAGSVGKPKDGDFRAGYVLLILEAGKIHVDYRRVDYNVSAAAQAVRDNGLPEQFASQLEVGGEEILVSV